MDRREMVEQLLEQFESELDELTNTQLEALVEEYEHSPLLGNLVNELVDPDEEEEVEDDELTYVDDDSLDN